MTIEVVSKAHRIRLNPTPAQEQYFWRCAGVARFTWNWALAEYNDALARDEKPKLNEIRREFNALRSNGFAPFVGEVQSYAYQYAFRDLQVAISRYHTFRKEGRLKPPAGWKPRKDGKPFGWPRFKARNKTMPAFGLANNGGMRFDGHSVMIQRCPDGPVNMSEPLRFDGKIMSGRVSYRAGHWYLSVSMQVDQDIPEHTGGVVGIDLGITHLAVTSDGTIYDNPKALGRHLRKLRRLQRHAARQTEGGANWKKTQQEIARLHEHISNIRSDNMHKMTTELAHQYSIIAVENLNVSGMVNNGKLARAVSDVGMYEARRQLTYKAGWKGGQVVAVDRWYPSSHLCNACGHKQGFELSVRYWICDACGAENHRDGNAALNIRDEGLRLL